MPNRELGIAVSSAAVSSDRGKKSTLGLAASAPALSATVRLCGEIVVALSTRVRALFTSSAIAGRSSGGERSGGRRRALFFEGVMVYGECAEKGERQLALTREKKGNDGEEEGEKKRADQCNIGGQSYVCRGQT